MKNKNINLFIPVYNGFDTIIPCLESALNQTYPCHTITIIDDGSTDETGSLVESYIAQNGLQQKLRLKRHILNEGLSQTRNEILSDSNSYNSTYTVMIDSDVIISSDWIETMVSFLETHPRCVFASGNLIETYRKGFANRWKMRFMNQGYGNFTKINPPFVHGAGCILRQSVISGSQFPQRYQNNGEDYLFSVQIKDKGYDIAYVSSAHAYHLKEFTSLQNIYATYYSWTKHEKENLSFIARLRKNMDIINHLNSKTKNLFWKVFNYTFYPVLITYDVMNQ